MKLKIKLTPLVQIYENLTVSWCKQQVAGKAGPKHSSVDNFSVEYILISSAKRDVGDIWP